MSGIAGIFYFSNRQAVDKNILKKMCDTLAHRGPDGEGFFCDKNIGLGYRFLRIIDSDTCKQPSSTENASMTAVFDGEIYNSNDLKNALAKKGHVLKSGSEAEIIVHAYQEWGAGSLNLLRGNFALAIWDKNKNQLFLGRDRIGEKPLYYYQDNNKLIFASELKAILQHPGIDKETDPQAVMDYFMLGYIPGAKSIYKKIRKLKPAHFAVISPGNMKIQEYWDVVFEPSITDPEKAKQGVLDGLNEAVRARLAENMPMGAFLSGGVDSSAVVATMAKNLKTPVVTNSIGFEEQAYNELPYAREIARIFKCDHHEHIVKPNAIEILDKLSWHYDEPFGDSSCIPTYYVAEMARRNIKVAFAGDGGDENFGGYRRYYIELKIDKVRKAMPAFIRKSLIAGIASVYPKADWLPQIFRGKTTFKNLARDFGQSNFNSMTHLHNDLDKVFFNKDFISSLKGYHTYSVYEEHYNKARRFEPLSMLQYADLKIYLVDDGIVKVDRAAAAVSLGVRAPILDHKYIEYLATISSSLKIKDAETKYIFKKALEDFIPKSNLYRKKQGFSMPVSEWLRNEIKDYAYDLIFQEKYLENYINIRLLKRMWDNHQKKTSEHSTRIWDALMFCLWKKRFL